MAFRIRKESEKNNVGFLGDLLALMDLFSSSSAFLAAFARWNNGFAGSRKRLSIRAELLGGVCHLPVTYCSPFTVEKKNKRFKNSD